MALPQQPLSGTDWLAHGAGAAPLTPDARQRIVAELLDLRSVVSVSVTVGRFHQQRNQTPCRATFGGGGGTHVGRVGTEACASLSPSTAIMLLSALGCCWASLCHCLGSQGTLRDSHGACPTQSIGGGHFIATTGRSLSNSPGQVLGGRMQCA